MKKLIPIIVLLGFVVSGCATPSSELRGKEIDTQMISKIELNKSTKSEILEWFGLPDRILTTAKGREIYKYVFVPTKSKATSSKKPRFITLTFVIRAKEGIDTRYQELNIIFKDDIVIDYTSSTTSR